MESKKNILAGNNKFNFYLFILVYFFLINHSFAKDNAEGVFIDLKILVESQNGHEINLFFNWLLKDSESSNHASNI